MDFVGPRKILNPAFENHACVIAVNYTKRINYTSLIYTCS